MCVYKFILHTWARKFKTIHNFGFAWRSNPNMSRRFAFNSKTGGVIRTELLRCQAKPDEL